MYQTVHFDRQLIQKYDTAGPRYTSYPTAVQFHEGFGEDDYRIHARATNDDPIPRPLSLYVHIPFCATVCYYCACNKVVTKNRARAAAYLVQLKREIALQASLFDKDRQVDQLHWGGGTPTFLNHGQLRDLMTAIRRPFTLRDDDAAEYSIEIDPRGIGEVTIALLRDLGFNRVSIGAQDFNPQVQLAVNRVQTQEETVTAMEAARREGFKSINLDLMYGLPLQTVESFDQTLDTVIMAGPDRLSVFNYAHLPERFKTQRQIREADLPSAAEKLEILQHTIEKLTSAGYVYIGMDHFARPDDELASAQRNGTLCRNFQGYSTHGDCDLVGMGITAIGTVGDAYAQNIHDLDEYQRRLDAGHLAIQRGVQLSPDDRLRQEIIGELICHFSLDTHALEQRWGIDFNSYFAFERPRLEGMLIDGLLALKGGTLVVLPAGRLLIRNICMVFDKYLRDKSRAGKFSKVI
ncbi:MAG: oxygen-independent coproporphyrinogen III oxidase [Acidiferrobacterales bacterium]